MKKRLLAGFLALMMLVNTLPVPALAEKETEWEVAAFELLDADIAFQTVSRQADGTEPEPNLPDTLEAWAYKIEDDSDAAGVPGEGQLSANAVEKPEAAKPEPRPVTISPVTWTAEPEYDQSVPGQYVYTPVLPAVYVVAEGVELPVVTVTVETAEDAGLPADTVTAEAEEEQTSARQGQAGENALELLAASTYDGLTITTAEGGSVSKDSNGKITLGSSGTYTISGTWNGTLKNVISNKLNPVICVEAGIEAEITLENANISVGAEGWWRCAFHISPGARAKINLVGENVLQSNAGVAGLSVPEHAAVEISGEGRLEAVSTGMHGAGIGGGNPDTGFQNSGTITINSGIVIAAGSRDAQNIGGGVRGNTGAVNRNGGLIIEGSSGQVYDDTVITGNWTIPAGTTVTIPAGKVLMIPEGVTLTNSGSLINNGVIIKKGAITGNAVSGSGKMGAFLITLKSAGGSLDADRLGIADSETTYSGLPVSIKRGYIFDGWFTEENGGSRVENGTAFSKKSDHTLYAHWSVASYRVTFDPNGGTVSPTSKVVTYDGAYGPLPTPANGSEPFLGWYTEPVLGSLVEQDTIADIYDCDHTLYARWKNPTYIGADGTDQSFPSNYQVVTGQTTWNDGWYVVNGHAAIDSRITVSGDVHLILMDGCSLTARNGITVEEPDSLTIYAQSREKSTMGRLEAKGGGAGIGGRRGNLCGTVTVNGGNIIAEGDNNSAGIGHGAGVSGKNGTITINGGNVEAKGKVWGPGIGNGTVTITGGIVTTDSGDGADFGAVPDDRPSRLVGGLVIKKREKTATVYSDTALNGDLEIAAGIVLTVPDGITLTIPENMTLTNSGEIKLEGTGKIDLKGTLKNNGRFQIRVMLDKNDSISKPDAHYVNYGGTYGNLPAPARNGYAFLGWFTEPGGGAKVESGAPVKTIDTHTLYAHWETGSYVVKLETNGGTITSGNVESYIYGKGALLPAAVTRTGCTFTGWYENADCAGTPVTEIPATAYGQKTFYAGWRAEKYIVTFDAKGGSVSPETMEVTYNSPYGVLPRPVRAGCVFIGWYTAETGGTEAGADTLAAIADNHTLYARWREMIPYIDETGKSQELAEPYVSVTGQTGWSGGWYVVDGNQTIGSTITVSGDVKLILVNGCKLTAARGINIQQGCSLTIYAQSTNGGEMGELEAVGVSKRAGIDNSGANGGTITINGGRVTAKSEGAGSSSGSHGAGIGGAHRDKNTGGTGKIIINGGIIAASGGYGSAGIGGGNKGGGTIVQINGGVVTANGGGGAAGIGGGKENGGSITIQNSVIIANGQNPIGNGTSGSSSMISQENCIIFAGSGSTGTVYGSPTLNTDAEIPAGKTIIVGDGQTLTIPAGITLTNSGTIKIEGTGKLKMDGTVSGSGPMEILVTLIDNGETPAEKTAYAACSKSYGESIPRPSRGGYTFAGWYTAAEGGDCVNDMEVTMDTPRTLYARWRENKSNVEVTVFKDGQEVTDAAYGDTITITAAIAKAPADNGLRAAGQNQVTFSLGDKTLGTADVSGNQANLTVTLTGEEWKPEEGAKTIAAEFGGSADFTGSTGTGELTVQKATPQVTPPEGISGLTYNSQEQTLIRAGSTGVGTMQYSFSESSGYFADLPKGTDAGSYTVWYKVAGDDYYNDVTGSVSAAIAPKSIAGAAVTLGDSLTYTGSRQTQTVQSVTIDGLNATYEVAGNQQTNAGDQYTLTVTGTGNYTGSQTADFTIARAANSISGLTCGDIRFGETPRPFATARFGTIAYTYGRQENGGYGSWNTANAVDTWYVRANVAGTSNYEAAESGPAAFRVTAKPETVPNAGIDYTRETLTGLEANVKYIITPGEGQKEEVTVGGNGEISVRADWFGKGLSIIKKASDSNHSDSDPQSISVPSRPEPPAAAIMVTKSCDSITVVNKADFSGCQFSIDGSSWQDGESFNGLNAEQSYSVSVRKKAAANAFVSDSRTKNVTTAKADGSTVLKPGESIETGGVVITNDGEKITIRGGGTTTTITPAGEIEAGGDGTVTVPGGSVVKTGEGGPEITVGPGNGGTVGSDGTITVPEGGTVRAGREPVAIITPPRGGQVIPNPDGTISLPGGTVIKAEGRDPVTVPGTGGIFDPGGGSGGSGSSGSGSTGSGNGGSGSTGSGSSGSESFGSGSSGKGNTGSGSSGNGSSGSSSTCNGSPDSVNPDSGNPDSGSFSSRSFENGSSGSRNSDSGVPDRRSSGSNNAGGRDPGDILAAGDPGSGMDDRDIIDGPGAGGDAERGSVSANDVETNKTDDGGVREGRQVLPAESRHGGQKRWYLMILLPLAGVIAVILVWKKKKDDDIDNRQ